MASSMPKAEGAHSGQLRGASGRHCHACISQWRGCASHNISHALVRAALARCVQIGVYNEQSLERLDLVLSEAGKSGIRIIFPFVNFWPDLGGMQWYVDQVCPQLPASSLVASLLHDLRGRWGRLDPSSHRRFCGSPPFSRPWPGMGHAAGCGPGYAHTGPQELLVVGVGLGHSHGPIDGNGILLGH